MVVIATLSEFGACLPSSRAEKCVVAIARWGRATAVRCDRGSGVRGKEPGAGWGDEAIAHRSESSIRYIPLGGRTGLYLLLRST